MTLTPEQIILAMAVLIIAGVFLASIFFEPIYCAECEENERLNEEISSKVNKLVIEYDDLNGGN